MAERACLFILNRQNMGALQISSPYYVLYKSRNHHSLYVTIRYRNTKYSVKFLLQNHTFFLSVFIFLLIFAIKRAFPFYFYKKYVKNF